MEGHCEKADTTNDVCDIKKKKGNRVYIRNKNTVQKSSFSQISLMAAKDILKLTFNLLLMRTQ